MRNTIIFLVALVTGTMCGCRDKKQLLSLADFEQYYTGTRWYWSEYQSNPSKLTGFKVKETQGWQAFLTSPSGTHITYKELEPSNFLKAFPGIGKLKELGMTTEGLFVVGFPGDTKDDVWRTLDFANSLPLDSVSVAAANPFPGTELYRTCERPFFIPKKL